MPEGPETPPRDGEASLMAAAREGEHEALRALWNRHRRWIAAVILAHKPRWADLEDLLQDVGATMVRKIGELRDPAAIRPWLRTVAINTARAAARDKSKAIRRIGALLEDHDAALARIGAASPAAEPEAREEASRLMDLAMQLPEGYREPLLLRCLRDMSYRQIGELVGLPESTIETRIARGRRMLRELASAPREAGPQRAGPRTQTARQGTAGEGP